METDLERTLRHKTIEIYSVLLSLGNQTLEIVSVSPKNYPKIQTIMSIYFQASQSRYELIEWLIATINPYYDQDIAYKNSYHDHPHQHKINKLSICLWQLGVMPYSKFTKNLDYGKYIQGLLGQENAVNLIYDLAILASQKYSSNKGVKQLAQQILRQLISNKKQLVNADYDPYGITFPPKIFLGKDFQNEKKIIEFEYASIQKQILDSQIEEDEGEQIQKEKQSQSTKMFEEIQTYKQLFQHKYSKFLAKIIQLEPKMTILGVSGQKDKEQKKIQASLHESRQLNITKDFCQKYRRYKTLTTSIQPQQYQQSLDTLKTDLLKEIQQINEIHDIFAI